MKCSERITVVNILPAYGAAHWMKCCGICASLPEPENLSYFLKHVAKIINSVSKFTIICHLWIKQANGIDEKYLMTTVVAK